MLSYCLKCRKNTKSKNPAVVKTKNRRIMLLSICSACNSNKPKFLRGQEARGLLTSLGIRKTSSEISWLCSLLF